MLKTDQTSGCIKRSGGDHRLWVVAQIIGISQFEFPTSDGAGDGRSLDASIGEDGGWRLRLALGLEVHVEEDMQAWAVTLGSSQVEHNCPRNQSDQDKRQDHRDQHPRYFGWAIILADLFNHDRCGLIEQAADLIRIEILVARIDPQKEAVVGTAVKFWIYE